MDIYSAVIPIGLLFLFYLHAFCSDVEVPASRYKDKPFPPKMMIYNRTIECAESFSPGKFPAQTWTCRDMRVDGLRMGYGYNPSIYKDNNRCVETGGFDDLGELCRRVMAMIGSHRQLWAAFVSNATCDYIKEERLLLNMTHTGYEWHKMKPGYGWVETLQCMAMK